MELVNMIKNADTQARNTLIGTLLIKLSTGVVGIWGSCNIYFFSYMKHEGQNITLKTNSLIIIISFIPSCFFVLLSTTIAKKIGYQLMIRSCSLMFMISPFLINFNMNLIYFSIFWFLLPVVLFSLAAIPIINALWTQFPKDLNKVTGLAVLFFSIGMILWNVIFTFIVNPNNLTAKLDQNGLSYFDPQVSNQIFVASNTVCLLSGSCNIIGSYLIKRRDQGQQKALLITKQQQTEIKLSKLTENVAINEIGRAVSTISNSAKMNKSLLQNLKDKKFITIFCISFLVPSYLIYIVMNMKYLYMPIINDDHFLIFCSALVTIAAIVGAAFWGYIGDQIGFKKTLVLIVATDCIVKIAGVNCSQKWSLSFLFFFLGVNDKGLLTIIGPGLVDMFGVEMATQLLPYKGISLFLAYLTTPLIQLFFSGYFSYQQLLYLFFAFSMKALVLTIYLMRQKYKSYIEQPTQREMRTIQK